MTTDILQINADLSAAGPPQGARAPSGGSAAHAVASVGEHESACSGSEAFALRVLGTSMEPEFMEGEIIVIEPEGQLRDGSYVLARHEGEWIFRQLCQAGEDWRLHALNPAFPDLTLPALSEVRGVVIQKALPGRRNASKRYV
jgi:DNA polymerase V